MLTKKDRQQLLQDFKEVFLTKEDAKQFVTKNDLIKFKDEMVGRLDKIDQELVMTNAYGDQLEDHESRIVTLEKNSKTS